jgi:hypothetical protein
VCSSEACQKQRQLENMASWRQRHPDYPARRQIRLREIRAAKGEVVDPPEVAAPLDRLPWDVAQKSFGVQGADFIGHLGRVLAQESKKSMAGQVAVVTGESGRLPP